jgi:ABC-2 type transport system permease protein
MDVPNFGRRSFAYAGKELKVFFQDPQALFFAFALPLVLILLMVAVFGGQSRFNANAYVVNLDRGGTAGADLAARLSALPGLTVKLVSEEEATRRLADADINNVVFIPVDFTARLTAGETPRLLVRQRGLGGTEGQIVNSFAAGLAREIAGEYLVSRQVGQALASMGRPLPEAEVKAKVGSLFAVAKADPPVRVEERAVGARSEPAAIFLPGIVTMYTLFSVSLSSVAIVEERRRGLMERLTTTRLTRAELLGGTWLGSAGRGALQVVFLFGLAWAAFRIFTPISFLTAMVVALVGVLSISAVGLIIAAISRTPDQANWTGVFLTMVMSFLGGSFFDVTAAKGVLGGVSRLTYNFWANDALRRVIARGETLASPGVGRDLLVLAGIAAGGWLVALLFFRMRGDAA